MKRMLMLGAAALSISVYATVGVAACGGTTANGGSTGGGSASGTVGGVTLAVADAVAIAEGGTPGVDARVVLVELLDIPNVCALLQNFPSNADKGNYTGLGLQVSVFGVGGAGSVVAGTYTINGGGVGVGDGGIGAASASATLDRNDAQCTSTVPTADRRATGGTITISSISAAGVTGSYSATFKDGTLSGSFNAAFCSRGDGGTGSADGGGPRCVQ